MVNTLSDISVGTRSQTILADLAGGMSKVNTRYQSLKVCFRQGADSFLTPREASLRRRP